jgi:hypothetical protein
MRSFIAAGAEIDEGSALRFLQQPIVNAAPDETAPRHQLHDVVRNMIRSASFVTDHAWSDSDWGAAAHRMLALLERRAGATPDPDERLDAALAAFDIASDLALEVPWLAKGLFEHPARARVARQVVSRCKQKPGSWTASVERVLSCWEQGGSGASDVADRLQAVAGEPGLSKDLRRRALRYRAYTERTLTHHDSTFGVQAVARADGDWPDGI